MAERLSTPSDPVPQVGRPVCAVGPEGGKDGQRQPPELKAGKGKPPRAKSQPVVPLEPSPPPLPSRPEQPVIAPTQQPPEAVRPWWVPMGNRETASFLASCVFHTVLLLALALVLPGVVSSGSSPRGVIASTSVPVPLESATGDDAFSVELLRRQQRTGDSVLPDEILEVPKINDLRRGPVNSSDALRAEPGRDPTRSADWLLTADTAVGGGLEGRKSRAALAAQRGGSPASENAVERGLKWLLAHQRDNGSWSFDHAAGCAATPAPKPAPPPPPPSPCSPSSAPDTPTPTASTRMQSTGGFTTSAAAP